MKKLSWAAVLMFSLLLSFTAWAEDIFTSAAPSPTGSYSQAFRVGNTVYISGQIPMNPQTNQLISGDFRQHGHQSRRPAPWGPHQNQLHGHSHRGAAGQGSRCLSHRRRADRNYLEGMSFHSVSSL